uniref:Uncharacterized protein n=1 Tax=Romanomermis culicivorax TaxID=13658 RepID=A0A915JJH7_ROMCU
MNTFRSVVNFKQQERQIIFANFIAAFYHHLLVSDAVVNENREKFLKFKKVECSLNRERLKSFNKDNSPVIMGGDFNKTVDENLDKQGGSIRSHKTKS